MFNFRLNYSIMTNRFMMNTVSSSGITVYFSEAMQQKNSSFSPSSSKPAQVIVDWEKHFPGKIAILPVQALNKDVFKKIHQTDYVNGIFNGTKANGFGLKDAQFSDTFLYTSGSLYQASIQALETGLAISPTSGFHHAGYAKAEGFCTFNGLVLVAKMLFEQHHVDKIGILDFDMHYGNGTVELLKKHHMNYVTHYTAGRYYDLYYPSLNFIKPVIKSVYNHFFTQKKVTPNNSTAQPQLRQKLLAKKGKGDDFIAQIPDILERFKECKIIIYQAGADQHINDPYGGLLTYEQMIERDRLVFEFAKNNQIPLVWNLAGGYQRDSSGSIEPVLQCHRNTFETCLRIYR
jgi:acetoin utilization deacetylase AcuC-like enzyme